MFGFADPLGQSTPIRMKKAGWVVELVTNIGRMETTYISVDRLSGSSLRAEFSSSWGPWKSTPLEEQS